MTLPLTQDSITTLVHEFYAGVRADPELGPVFAAAIDDWPPHLARMVEFWSTTMLKTRSFQGNVYGKHMALPGVQPQHFQRWLALFQQTVDRLFAPEVAEEFRVVASRIAQSLQYGFFGQVHFS
ncbi:group III truncated hemoglobin [Pseudoduganella sp.]|uniref:group III truncated hemoglobin n=1 Tax=Pseudoduganella sp. TaxID=1880898 RepID=UPI0035AE0B2F